VRIDGLVEREKTIDIDLLLRRIPLEERVYRHRCVETWSMTVPWTGFPMRALVDLARPLAAARYVEMQTFFDPEAAPGQRQAWYPWQSSSNVRRKATPGQFLRWQTESTEKPPPKSRLRRCNTICRRRATIPAWTITCRSNESIWHRRIGTSPTPRTTLPVR